MERTDKPVSRQAEMHLPKVSIITVYYNRRDYIDSSLESLLSQTYQNVEIIAVDDGSTDDTATRLGAFEVRGVRVVSHSNRGFSQAIRDAVQLSSGELIAIHGSGDLSAPSRIERQVQAMRAAPDAVLCGVASRNLDEKTRRVIDRQTFAAGDLAPEHFQEAPPFTHGAVLFRRAAYEAAGGYDPRFLLSQDWDLWLRMLARGRGLFLAEELYDRLVLQDGASFNAKKAYRQLFFKHLALQLTKVDCAQRDDVIGRALAALQSDALSEFSQPMRLDLSRRMVKVALLGQVQAALDLKGLLNEKFGGPMPAHEVARALARGASSLGVSPAGFSRPARWVLDRIRARASMRQT